MASTLDLYIDTGTGELVQAGASEGGDLPTLTRNDSYTLRLRLLEKKADGTLGDIDTAGATLKAAIGDIEAIPSDGDFKLICNGITSSAISFNASAGSVFTAVSNNVSTVSIYGNQYLLTATQPNTAMSFSADSFTLFPASSVVVGTRRNPATGVNAQQTIRLQKDPAVFSDTFITSPTSGEIALTLLSEGSATKNETYELVVGPGILGGAFSLVFGPNATTSIAIGTNAVTVQAAISSGINTITSNMSVQENGKGGYIIAFTGRLGLTNITTALTLDATGVDFAPFKQTTLTLNTAELADFFTNADADSITPTLEIELTQNGNPKTILQKSVTIRKDLITTGSFAPSTGQSFYTAAQCDALFVEDSVSNVNAAGRALVDSVSVTAFNYGTRELINSSGSQVVSYGAGLAFANTPLGFYGTTVTAQPANINVVSGLIAVGLIASGTTYGVLPRSSQTLTTTASLAFGTLAGHSTSAGNVTVTGATVGDLVLVGLPAAVSAGVVVQGVVFAANTVCMTAINGSNSSKTVGTADYRITVIDY
jgi:hypothetical protein